MADEKNERRDSAQLDASLSVLGDEGKEPKVERVGPAPRPAANGNLEQALDKGRAKPGDGNHDETSERAAKDAIRGEVDDYGKR